MTYTLRVALILGTLLWVLPCVVRGQAPADSDVELLKRKLLERDKCLYAVSLTYREVERSVSSLSAPGEYVRRELAVSRSGWFKRDNCHGHDQLHWQDDPFRKTVLVGPAGWKVLAPINRTLHDGPPLSGGFPEPGSAYAAMAEEFVFLSLSWWPFEKLPPPALHGRSISLAKLFEDGRYEIREDREGIDGRACIVLEVPGVDEFYVDAAAPLCIVRRDIWNTDNGSVAIRFEYGGYERYGDGIYLPGTIRNIQFDSNAHTALLRQRRVVDSRFVISKVAVNDNVDARDFQLDIRPGTVRNLTPDESAEAGGKHWEAVCDGQGDHLNSLVGWVERAGFYEQKNGIGYKGCLRHAVSAVLGFGLCWIALAWRNARASN